MKKITELQLAPLTTTPKLVQTFYSLEGEGQSIGRSAIYIRTGICSLRCNFCDSKFSVEGKEEFNIVDMCSDVYVEHMHETFIDIDKTQVENLSITGGEPLLHLNHLDTIIENTLKVFPNISKIIFETNGTMLSVKNNCALLIKKLSKFSRKIKFVLSISPKLSSSTSFSNLYNDTAVLEIYKNVVENYITLLNTITDIQIKFVHSAELQPFNLKLENIIKSLNFKYDYNWISNNEFLIMPLTPLDPLGKDLDEWNKSKDDAAKYAMTNFYRYSPRIHVDRRLD